MIAEEPTLTPRARLRAWVEEHIDERDETDIQALVTLARSEFLTDASWVEAMYGPMLAALIRELIGQMRPHDPILGDTLTKRGGKTFEDRLEDLVVRKWGRWTEAVPGKGYVKLFAMRAPELRKAAAARTSAGNEQIRVATFLGAVAARLHGDEQVRDRFTAVELEHLEMDLRAEGN